LATRQGATKGVADWKQLAIDGRAEKNPGVQVIDRHVLGQNVFEFSIAVVDDKGSRLGRLTYGLSDGPLQKALSEARADSRHTLLLTVGLLLLLGIVTIVMGALRSQRSAARITQPVTDLTQAVNTLASGRRDIRVNIASGDELQILGGAFKQHGRGIEGFLRTPAADEPHPGNQGAGTYRELADRNRDMRLVLDTSTKGFSRSRPRGCWRKNVRRLSIAGLARTTARPSSRTTSRRSTSCTPPASPWAMRP